MTAPVRAFLLAIVVASLSSCAHATTDPQPMRIAVVGDSLAFGAGDEEEMGIAGRLENELRLRGIAAVATTNYGRIGATTRDFRATLESPAVRETLAGADAIVLSIGANDLREAFLTGRPIGNPFDVFNRVLRDVRGTVDELHRISPGTPVLLLGAYLPLPGEGLAVLLEPLIAIWDTAVMAQFLDDPLVSVVRMSDILDRPERLSQLDSFHPGAEAYQETARRIAELLVLEGSVTSERVGGSSAE